MDITVFALKAIFPVECTEDVTGLDENGFRHHLVNTLSYNNSQKPGKSQIWLITVFASIPLIYYYHPFKKYFKYAYNQCELT